MKYWLFIATVFVAALSLAVFDVAFVGALGYPLRLISSILIVSLYAIIVLRDQVGFLLFCVGTLAASLAASTLLVAPLLVGSIVLLIVSHFVERLFTNRNYYSMLAVASIGWAIYHLLLSGVTNVFLLITPGGTGVVFPTPIELMFSWLALALILTTAYAGTVLFSKKIRSYFIVGASSV
jgi:hypothetical protein